jgi:uncharacterized membrane protein YhaH (DUF805 family)
MTDVNFGYRQPPSPSGQPDSPLSANGRFGRLSYLAWLFVSTFVFYIAIFVAIFAFGVSGAMLGQTEANSGLFGGLSIIAILGFVVVYIVFLYFIFVFAIRRLHDLNQTGWLSLLFLVPLVNIIFGLYVLFAKGTPGTNNYGPQRITKGWETVLGWIYIVIMALSLALVGVFSGSIISALSQSSAQLEQSNYDEEQLDDDMAKLKAQLEQLEQDQQNAQH